MAELEQVPASQCCSAEAQETCCDPAEKKACCGESAAGGCGCKPA